MTCLMGLLSQLYFLFLSKDSSRDWGPKYSGWYPRSISFTSCHLKSEVCLYKNNHSHHYIFEAELHMSLRYLETVPRHFLVFMGCNKNAKSSKALKDFSRRVSLCRNCHESFRCFSRSEIAIRDTKWVIISWVFQSLS